VVRQISRASDDKGLKWTTSGTEYREVDLLDLISAGGDANAKVAILLASMLQDEEDIVDKRSDLPNDEETRTTNPNKPNIFWRGGDIVTRSNIVTVEFVGGEYVPTVRVA